MAKNIKRDKVRLQCTVCKEINYDTTKNKQKNPERIVLNKFCPKCAKKTEHKETK